MAVIYHQHHPLFGCMRFGNGDSQKIEIQNGVCSAHAQTPYPKYSIQSLKISAMTRLSVCVCSELAIKAVPSQIAQGSVAFGLDWSGWAIMKTVQRKRLETHAGI